MSYHQFKHADGNTHGSFEVFHDDSDNANGHDRNYDQDGNPVKSGWYWWACFPGCLPDGDAIGPFKTRQQAIDDANNFD